MESKVSMFRKENLDNNLPYIVRDEDEEEEEDI